MDAHYAGFQGKWCNRTDEASAVVPFRFQHQTLVAEGDGLTVFDLYIEDMRMSRGLGLGLGNVYFKYGIYILIA